MNVRRAGGQAGAVRAGGKERSVSGGRESVERWQNCNSVK